MISKTGKLFSTSFFFQINKRNFLDKSMNKKFFSKFLFFSSKSEIDKNIKFLKIGLDKFFLNFLFGNEIFIHRDFMNNKEIKKFLFFFFDFYIRKNKKFKKIGLYKNEKISYLSSKYFISFLKFQIKKKIPQFLENIPIVNFKNLYCFKQLFFFNLFYSSFEFFSQLNNFEKKKISNLKIFKKKKSKNLRFPYQKKHSFFFKKLLKINNFPKKKIRGFFKALSNIYFNKKLKIKFFKFYFHPFSKNLFFSKNTKKNFKKKFLVNCSVFNFNFYLNQSNEWYFTKNEIIVRKYSAEFQKIFKDFKIKSKKSKTFLQINKKKYIKLELLGKGGSGKVYKIIDEKNQIFALKKTKTINHDFEVLHNCINEISILKTFYFQPRVIQIKNADISLEDGSVFIVLEYGETDLENIIKKKTNGISNPTLLKYFWKQSLEAVQTIHEERIIHGDLKPSNFLLVNNSLKIIDFGIARQIQKDTTNITRSVQIGTLNYMSPEAMVDISNIKEEKKRFRLGRSADIWSLGCIFFQMVYGKPPFYHLDFVKKIQAIINKTFEILFLPVDIEFAIDVMKGCLQRNPEARPSIPELLVHPFLVSRSLINLPKIK